jgi:hypothetical protein
MMKRAFGCQTGAYSPVTRDEFNKQQVTLVGPEQQIAEDHFKGRIEYHQGSIAAIRAAGHNPEVTFRLHPSGKPINLTLSYKTNKPNELRLYLRTHSCRCE